MSTETLLLIPGMACDQTVWQHQIEGLSDLVNIVVADLNGVDTMEQMVAQVMENIPETFYLAGHSLGGVVCFEIMKKHAARVKKLCLLATNANADSLKETERRLYRIQEAQEGNFERLIQNLTVQFTLKESIRSDVYDMFKRNKNLLISQQKALLHHESSVPMLETINQPTMVLVGHEDNFFFKYSKQIAHKIKKAEFQVIEHCGHMLTMECPEETTHHMRAWLSGCGVGRAKER